MSGFRLHAHDVLRDPTKDELYNGPKREKLPEAVQKMDVADTACTFCGVSYFVFAEVQELQERVKKYEKNCRTFTSWVQYQKTANVTMRSQMMQWNQGFQSAYAQACEKLKECDRMNAVQRSVIQSLELKLHEKDAEGAQKLNIIRVEYAVKMDGLEDQLKEKTRQLESLEQKLEQAFKDANIKLQAKETQWKQERATLEMQWATIKSSSDQEIQRLEGLAFQKEQELQASALHMHELEAQVERCNAARLDAVHAKEEMVAFVNSAQTKIEEAQRLQQLAEANVIQVKADAARAQANAEVERTETSHLHEEIARWKHQATGLEKSKALLLQERQELKQEVAQSDEKIKQVKNQVTLLQQKLDEQMRLIDSQAQAHKKALDTVKAEWAKDVANLKSLSANSLDSTKSECQAQMEALQDELRHLKLEVPHAQQSLVVATKKGEELEKALQEAKARCQSYMEELQAVKLSSHQAKSTIGALERKVQDLETQHKEAVTKLAQERADWDRKQTILDKNFTERNAKVHALEQEIAHLRQLPPREVVKEVVVHKAQSSNNDLDKEIERLNQQVAKKEEEIHLLQLTVHRECMERTSMLEKMRSAKILPDLITTGDNIPFNRNEVESDPSTDESRSGLASFYEKLRKKKPRAKKSAW